MDIEGRRSMSWSPPKWRRKTLCNEDEFSSDEDALPSAQWNRRMQTARSMEGSKLKPSVRQLNTINLEDSQAEPPISHNQTEDHLHGSGWQDPICVLFQKANEWQDPICALFQTKNSATCTTESLGSDGSCKLVTPLERSTTSSSRTNSGNGGFVDYSVQEKELKGPPKSLQSVTGCLSSAQHHRQATLFKDTRFPPELIERAIQLHGAQADDSIVLQFLLDWREKNALKTDYEKQDKSYFKFQNKDSRSTEENVSFLLTISQQIANSTRKNETEQIWDIVDSDSSDSDFDDDDDETIQSMPQSSTDRTVEDRSDNPPTLFKRELPAGEGYRNLMKNHGFEANVVDRAIQELGEGVEYDMLLEYLLYLTAQQYSQAPSISASCDKRASVTKNLVEERSYPSKEQASCKKPVTTVEKLMEGCGNPTKAVERPVANCETPYWNAKQDRKVDPVDFIAAYGAGSNKSESESHSDEDPQEDTDWSWLRQNVEEDLSTSISGKRKLCYSGVPRRKPIVRLNHPSSLKREQFDQPPLSRMHGMKPEKSEDLPPSRRFSVNREKFDDLPPGRRLSVKPEESDDLPNRRPIHMKKEQLDPPPLRRSQLLSRMPKVKVESSQRRGVIKIGKPRLSEEGSSVIINKHKASVGFGLPGTTVQPRHLDEDVKGAPFFYFENVANMPNDEWERIRRHLFDIEPEFVDSLHFSACRRPRGYIHNLPIEGRRKILRDPPMTIQELLPHTKSFWPAWDPRTKLNCITTRMGSEFLIKKLHIGEGTALQTTDPSPDQQREILHLCRHWNLVWTAPNIPTPIDETEIEAMLGFDAGHSRNILSNRSRYKALGNSFSVYTVAFHFSVLKPLYPKGIKVLSLFSGIGGAEVALHKMGMKLLVVVSVEIDDGTRRCLEAWWATSKQTGVLNQNYHNIKDLGRAQISELVNKYGGFDLIVGGTPCNNLSGSNHVTRVGLDGTQSAVFFEFSRVVAAVRELTMRLQYKK